MFLGESKKRSSAGPFDHHSKTNIVARLETQPRKTRCAVKCRTAHEIESADTGKRAASRPIDPCRPGAKQKQQHKRVHDDVEQEAFLNGQRCETQMINTIFDRPAERQA